MQRNRALNKVKAVICLLALISIISAVCLTIYATDFEGNGIYFEIDKNPIDHVEVVVEKSTLKCGEKATLDAIAYPQSAMATILEKSFYIYDGAKYGKIENNILTINDDAPVGAELKIGASIDGVDCKKYAVITVEATPVSRVEILNDEKSITYGGALSIKSALYPEDASNKHVAYSIVSNSPFVKISYSGILSFVNGADVPENSKITVRAASVSNPDVYDEITLDVLLPTLDVVNATSDLSSVNQQGVYSFDTGLTYLYEIFGNKGVSYSINVPQEIATIDDVKGLLHIMKSAPIGTEIIVTIEARDKSVSHTQKLTVEKVFATDFSPVNETNPTVNFMGKDYYLPGDEITFDVVSYFPINVTDVNKVFKLRVSDESMAYVDGNKVILKDVSSITAKNPKLTITVYSEPNGLETDFEIDIFIPISKITSEPNVNELTENTTYSVSDLIDFVIEPENATYFEYKYVLEATDYAELREGQLTIKDNLPSGELSVSLRVQANDSISNSISVSIYKPAHSLNIEASVNDKAVSEENLPVSSIANGDKIIFVTTVNEAASVNKSILEITHGSEYIEGEATLIKVEGRYAYWSIELKKNLGQYEGCDRLIKAKANQENAMSEEIAIEIYIPNEDFIIENSQVNRGNNFVLVPSHTLNATNKTWEFELSNEAISLGVEKLDDNTIYVPKSLASGTEIKIIYKLTVSGFHTEACEEKEVIYTVKSIKDENAKTVYDSQTLIDGLNFVFSKDSKGYAIIEARKQLWEDEYTDISIIFRNEAAENYGLTIKDIIVTGGGYEKGLERGNSKFRIHADSVDKNGKFLGDSIVIKAVIKDGNEEFTYDVATLTVFRPLSGVLSFNEITANNTSIKNYVSSNGTFTNNATYKLNDLSFSMANSSGVGISGAGVVKVTDYTINATQAVRYSVNQIYNSKTIPYLKESNITFKSISVNKDGGTGGIDSIIAISGLKGIKLSNPSKIIPSKVTVQSLGKEEDNNLYEITENYKFLGYGDYIDVNGTVLKDFNTLTELKADWLLITNYKELATWNGGRTNREIGNRTSYVEQIKFDLDKQTLINEGYNQVKITVRFDIKNESKSSKPLLKVMDKDGNICFEKEYTNYPKDKWITITETFYIDLDKLNQNNEFTVSWETKATMDWNNWNLGRTIYTMEAAIKQQ